MRRALLLVLLLAAPWPSFAGQGYIIKLANQLTSTDGYWPLLTVHAVDGATCWYDYDLGNWDKFAVAKGPWQTFYTEQKGAAFTACIANGPWLRHFALFIKTSADAGWKKISNTLRLSTSYSSVSHFRLTDTDSDPLDISSRELAGFDHPGSDGEQAFTMKPYCGVQIGNGGAHSGGSSYSWANGRPLLQLTVAGKLDAHCLSATPASASTAGVLAEPDTTPTNTIPVKLRVGQRASLWLPSLSENTSWELDHCVGDVITTGGVVPRKQKIKLPNKVPIRAVSRGTEECLISAWNYSSESGTRKHHGTLKYVFEVK